MPLVSVRGWMKVKYADYPAVGNFESDFFEPCEVEAGVSESRL